MYKLFIFNMNYELHEVIKLVMNKKQQQYY